MNSLDLIQTFLVFVLVFLSIVLGYSIGHKDGVRDERLRGRRARANAAITLHDGTRYNIEHTS